MPQPSTATRICAELLPESSRVLKSLCALSVQTYPQRNKAQPRESPAGCYRARICCGAGRTYFSRSNFQLHRSQSLFQMQFARTPVIIQTISCVRLLLCFDNHRARPQRMHRSAGNIDHVAGVDVDPVQQFFGAILVDRLLQLSVRSRPAFNPKAICAPGFACATYQHSVLPQG